MAKEITFRTGDTAYYYGARGHGLLVTVVRAAPEREAYAVLFVHTGPTHEVEVPAGSLHPSYPGGFDAPDYDLRVLGLNSPNVIMNEVMRLRGGLRHILHQEGDDLCWRDFYQVIAALLPDGDGLLAHSKSVPPRHVMLHNCQRFVDSLLAGRPEEYQPSKELDVLLPGPEDRIYRAADRTWWRRDEQGNLVLAEAPVDFCP